MRFLKSEHNAFKALINRSQLDYTSFSFIKKKGWLSISQESITTSFRFHRKQETFLDEKGKWGEKRTYIFGIEGALTESTEFRDVTTEFARWLLS